MRTLLAIDAGGTSTRAVVLDDSGVALGYGRAAGGNPTSAGLESAVSAMAEAALLAVGAAGITVDPGSSAVIALAGQDTEAFRARVRERLSTLGFGTVEIESDLLGMFHSGTHLSNGYALIAGTGTVTARIVDDRLEHVGGGTGWLLGDAGGGFWIGHHVVRAVVADLDGQGPTTALSAALLDALEIPADATSFEGRPLTLRRLSDALYALRPVQLARFAPLAFALHDDPVAREILVAASAALSELLASVRLAGDQGPVVVGGSVLIGGMLAAPQALRRALVPLTESVPLIPVPDGVVGAAVLAMRHAGVPVDGELQRAISADVEMLRVHAAADRGGDR